MIDNQDFESDERDIPKARIKTQLTGEKMKLETRLQALERRLSLVSMSTEFGLYPTEADLAALQEFFPTVNVRKIYEVENYHHKLASILDKQFGEERRSLEEEIKQVTIQLRTVQNQIQDLGLVSNLTTEFLDKHAEIKGRIDALKAQNAAYLKLVDLQEAKKRADEQLKSAIKSILSELEEAINIQMKEYNDTLYTEARKAPHLSLYETIPMRLQKQTAHQRPPLEKIPIPMRIHVHQRNGCCQPYAPKNKHCTLRAAPPLPTGNVVSSCA